MHHEIQLDRSACHAHFSAALRPLVRIEPGDIVTVSTPDVSWGLEPPTSTTAPRRKIEPRDPQRDNGPCLVGPIAVRGAQPGDTLAIHIERLRPGAWGWTYAGRGMSTPALNQALGVGDAPLTLLRWTLDRRTGVATSERGHTLAMRPFLGCMGLAPNEQHADGWTPRICGGNMDCRELTEHSTLYLPVMTEGAMLSVGDGHAAQGDGELGGTAIECMMDEVRLRVDVRRDWSIRGPIARTPAGWVSLGFGATLDEAAERAADLMLDLMERETGLSRIEALALAGAAVDLRVTQMVNPLRGVHAVWRGPSD